METRAAEKVTLVVAGGGLFAGSLGGFASSPGAVLSVGLASVLLEEKGFVPFLQLSGSFGFSYFRVTDTPYTALDIRVGLAAGYTFLERITPYAVVRAFGGPVFYGGLFGTDLFHFQLGAGLVVGLPLGLDLSVEFIPLGEQRISAGVGVSF